MPSAEVVAILGALAGHNMRRLNAVAIADATGLPLAGVKQRLPGMRDRGLVERVGGFWKVTRAGGAVAAAGSTAPEKDIRRQRMWTGLRKLKKATVADLLILAESEATPIACTYGGAYLRALERAGYVRALPRRRRTDRIAWVLLRDTGPRAPLYSPDAQTVADRNTGEVHRL